MVILGLDNVVVKVLGSPSSRGLRAQDHLVSRGISNTPSTCEGPGHTKIACCNPQHMLYMAEEFSRDCIVAEGLFDGGFEGYVPSLACVVADDDFRVVGSLEYSFRFNASPLNSICW